MAHLPIRIESVMPHDMAGTEAPLYNARGPFVCQLQTRSSAQGAADLLSNGRREAVPCTLIVSDGCALYCPT